MSDIAVGLKANKKNAYKKETLWQHIMKHKWMYIFLIPGVLYYLVFHYAPMYGIIIAFKDFNIYKGIMGSQWVGLEHFERLFKSSEFYTILRNSLVINVYKLVFGFPAPIIMALLLNEVRNVFFKRTIQTVIYLPHFISWVVVSGLVVSFLSPSSGVVNLILKNMGFEPIFFLAKKEYFRGILVASGIWKEMGWGTVVYLAALTGVDPQLYEAARVDGASRWKQTLHITLPGISTTIVVLLLLRLGNILDNGFEQVFMLYNPAVYEVGDVFETYVYRMGLVDARFDFSTAVGLFKSVIGATLLLSTNYLSKKITDKGLY